MGGCCGKENELDPERECNIENTNISSNGVIRASSEGEQADIFYIDDSEQFFNSLYTSRSTSNIDQRSRYKHMRFLEGFEQQSARPRIAADVPVHRTPLKENREEDERTIEKRGTSTQIPTNNKKIIAQAISDIEVSTASLKETGGTSTQIFTNNNKIIVHPTPDIKVDRTPLKEIGDENNREQHVEESGKITQIKANKKIVQNILETIISNIPVKIPAGEVYTLETVEPNSEKYSFVMSKFRNKKFRTIYRINKIEQIHNPYLLAQYELMKAKKTVNERILYHGTQMKHLDNICTYNFDWRVVKNSKYGVGVSFANNPYYASHYSIRNHCADEDYVMILVKVLVGRTCMGRPNLTCPPEGFDTTTNFDKQVLVKYDDCTFYPQFIIYFEEH